MIRLLIVYYKSLRNIQDFHAKEISAYKYI